MIAKRIEVRWVKVAAWFCGFSFFDLLKVWIWWGFWDVVWEVYQKNGSLVVEMKKPGCFLVFLVKMYLLLKDGGFSSQLC